jgi:hypothetical protein
MEYICIRCCLDFKEKVSLIRHLKKKRKCISLDKNVEDLDQLAELTKKEGLNCERCNRTYKNDESLRKHKCKSFKKDILSIHSVINDDIVTKKELKELYEKQVSDLKNVIKELLKNPQSVINNDNSTNTNNTNNTVNITLNCFMDTTGKPIEYLLNQENIKERVLGWMKSKNGILDYILEKFNNKDHPENKMIKSGENKESIELHVAGKWRRYDNNKGSDLILTNVGNDFDVYLEVLKEEFEEYTKNKKLIKEFEKDVMTPLQWGVDISEDSNKLNEKQMIKNENGEVVFEEDELERVKGDKIQTKVINVIHEKIC